MPDWSDSAEKRINENKEHTIFTWKTSSPTEVKNYDIPSVGFALNLLNELKTLQDSNHCYNLQPTRNWSYPKT